MKIRCGIRAYFRLNTFIPESINNNIIHNKSYDYYKTKDIFPFRPNGSYDIGFRFSYPKTDNKNTLLFDKLFYRNKKLFVLYKSSLKNKSYMDIIEIDNSLSKFHFDGVPNDIQFSVFNYLTFRKTVKKLYQMILSLIFFILIKLTTQINFPFCSKRKLDQEIMHSNQILTLVTITIIILVV